MHLKQLAETCCLLLHTLSMAIPQPTFSGKICKLSCEVLLWLLLLPYSGKDYNFMTSELLKIEKPLMLPLLMAGTWFFHRHSTFCELSKCSNCSDLENRVVNCSYPLCIKCLQSYFKTPTELFLPHIPNIHALALICNVIQIMFELYLFL